MKDLTVIMAYRNRERNLKACLTSISRNTYIPEVIVVDFGSNRNVASFLRKYEWLHVIRVMHRGIFHKSRALNIGIKAAKTKYVCMTDVDEVFQPNFFEIVRNSLTDNNFIRCKTYFLDIFPSQFIREFKYKSVLDLAKRRNFKRPHGEGCCHGVNLDWLLSARGYDERYVGWGFEDKDLVLRAEYSGLRMKWVDDKTSMVHLPHQRDPAYFSEVRRIENEKIFKQKRNSGKIAIKVNDNGWGKL